uniref:Uncharacterized protein n=1 Tax=Myoviridae sp. ct4uh47 TaxID=2825032 RepID=A0A8S5V5Z7_9CAUD|nr:MAG TPA: hypothetical protein [Myoviridae sp. ct4uh47]
MDALKFLKERKRMCISHEYCEGCPLKAVDCSDEECEKIIAVVEQWSKEHPRKTRQSVLLEQWPDARVDSNGVLAICPADVSAEPCLTRPCGICCREFWMQEVE